MKPARSRQPYEPPEGDHSEFMDRRRAEMPQLFTPTGCYKNFLHIFALREAHADRMVSIDPNCHIALPGELEAWPEPQDMLETLTAHYNVGTMKAWHPRWTKVWVHIQQDTRRGEPFLAFSRDVRRAWYYKLLDDPGHHRLAEWFLHEKRHWRQLNDASPYSLLSKKTAEFYMRGHLIHQQGV